MSNVRSRFHDVMNGKRTDRLPAIEWAMWWHLTIERWRTEGLPADLNTQQIKSHFGLDVDHQLWFPQLGGDGAFVADGDVLHGAMIHNEDDYDRLLPSLYPRPVPFDRDHWKRVAARQKRGEVLVWLTVEGFFWWPRRLLGVEPHMYAFYDSPALMKRINTDQANYIRHCVETFCEEICTPDFLTFAEDMSYNHGPMIGRDLFEEFLTPFYKRVVPDMKRRGIHVFIDSDGDIEPLIPWFQSAGLEGILPLERMAGVDVNRIRQNHPKWKMIGGFDKTVMHLGEQAIRKEFDRLLPAMKSGYFIPSVDHQTPPAVSIEQYRTFVALLDEYCAVACA